MADATNTPEDMAVLLTPKGREDVRAMFDRYCCGPLLKPLKQVFCYYLAALEAAEAENARLREKLESALDKIENIQDHDAEGVWKGVCHACGICAGTPEDWEPTDDHNCRVMLELWADGEPLPWEEAARLAVGGK